MQRKFSLASLFGLAVVSGILVTGIYVYGPSSKQALHAQNASANEALGSMDTLPDAHPGALPGGTRSAKDTRPTQNLPQPMLEVAMRPEVKLWDIGAGVQKAEVRGVPAMRLHVDPAVLDEFHVGQHVSLEIPHTGAIFESKITSTHNQLGGVKVWKAKINNGNPQDNIIVTQGQIETHLIVSTLKGTYTAVIDNKTGRTTLIDEGEIASRTIPTEDGIRAAPIDDSPPMS